MKNFRVTLVLLVALLIACLLYFRSIETSDQVSSSDDEAASTIVPPETQFAHAYEPEQPTLPDVDSSRKSQSELVKTKNQTPTEEIVSGENKDIAFIDDIGQPIKSFSLLKISNEIGQYSILRNVSAVEPFTRGNTLSLLESLAEEETVGIASARHIGFLGKVIELRAQLSKGPLSLTRCGVISVAAYRSSARLSNVKIHCTGIWHLAGHELPPYQKRFFEKSGGVLTFPEEDKLALAVDEHGKSESVIVPPNTSYKALSFAPGVEDSRPVICQPAEERVLRLFALPGRVIVGRVLGPLDSWSEAAEVTVYAVSSRGGMQMRRRIGRSTLSSDGSFALHLATYDGPVDIVLVEKRREQHLLSDSIEGVGIKHLDITLRAPENIDALFSISDINGAPLAGSHVSLVGDGGKFVQMATSDENGQLHLTYPKGSSLFSFTVSCSGHKTFHESNLSFDQLESLKEVVLTTKEPARRLTIRFPSKPSSHLGWDVYFCVKTEGASRVDIGHKVTETYELPTGATKVRIVDKGSHHLSDWMELPSSPRNGNKSKPLLPSVVEGGKLLFSQTGRYSIYDGQGIRLSAFSLGRSQKGGRTFTVLPDQPIKIVYEGPNGGWTKTFKVSSGESLQVVG